MNRRRFLEYAAGAAVAAGAAAGGYYLSASELTTNITTAPTMTSTRTNSPPVVSEIKVKPRYIDPTTEYVVQLSHDSYDPDGDPLKTTWFIDGKEVSHDHDYSTKLPEGHRRIVLKVSDSASEITGYGSMTVAPDQIYTTKPLHLKCKGITYYVGSAPPDWVLPNPDHDEMDEQLDTIRNELGCNAIIISGGGDYEDKLIECGRIAIEKGFERIHIQPRYMGATPSETVDRIGRFAPEVRKLREASESIIYSVGHEFSNETRIVPGDTWLERFAYPSEHPDWPGKVEAVLPKMFKNIITVCRQNYGFAISYAAIAVVEADLIPWEDDVFESVGVDAMIQEKYGWTENWIVDLLSRLKGKYHKPVDCMEAGCETFTGSATIAGSSPLVPAKDRRYDEDEQANWIGRECDTLDKARINGYFYTTYNDVPGWETGYGLYNPDTNKRKKGFYMYKRYRRAS